MMLVLCPSNSPDHTYMGPLFEFIGGVAFPMHHGGIFALKGSAPSRVYHHSWVVSKDVNEYPH